MKRRIAPWRRAWSRARGDGTPFFCPNSFVLKSSSSTRWAGFARQLKSTTPSARQRGLTCLLSRPGDDGRARRLYRDGVLALRQATARLGSAGGRARGQAPEGQTVVCAPPGHDCPSNYSSTLPSAPSRMSSLSSTDEQTSCHRTRPPPLSPPLHHGRLARPPSCGSKPLFDGITAKTPLRRGEGGRGTSNGGGQGRRGSARASGVYARSLAGTLSALLFLMIEAEGSCAQPQASKPAGALAQTAPEHACGPPAGSSQAGDGLAERRRSSVVVVALGQHHEKKGAAATASAVVVEQVRLTLMAVGLALTMAPIAAAIEPLVVFFSSALPNFEPTAPCQGLLTDRRGVDLVVNGVMGYFLTQNCFQVAAVDANARASRRLLHTLLVGAAASIACSAWYASAVASPSHAITYALLIGFVVMMAPFVSFAAWGLVTARRKSCERAVQGIIFGTSVSATAVTVGIATFFYVALSDQVSGFAGVAINGRDRWRDARVGKQLTRVNVGPGIVYPAAQFGLRSVLQRLLRGKVSSGSLDYAGVLVLLLEIITSTPQFYVLSSCVCMVVAYAFPCPPNLVLAGSTGRRSSSPRLFQASRASGSELLSLLERHTLTQGASG